MMKPRYSDQTIIEDMHAGQMDDLIGGNWEFELPFKVPEPAHGAGGEFMYYRIGWITFKVRIKLNPPPEPDQRDANGNLIL